jgi:hypothetical protein
MSDIRTEIEAGSLAEFTTRLREIYAK